MLLQSLSRGRADLVFLRWYHDNNKENCFLKRIFVHRNDIDCEDGENLAPYILLVGDVKSHSQVFLVIDKKIVTEFDNIDDVPFYLMSAFFVFNVQYLMGYSNFYTLMEIYTLDYPIEKIL